MTDASKKPIFHAYTVRNYSANGSDKSHWLQIGVAFKHGNGEGYDIVLQAVPVDGRITLRAPLPKDEKGGAADVAQDAC